MAHLLSQIGIRESLRLRIAFIEFRWIFHIKRTLIRAAAIPTEYNQIRFTRCKTLALTLWFNQWTTYSSRRFRPLFLCSRKHTSVKAHFRTKLICKMSWIKHYSLYLRKWYTEVIKTLKYVKLNSLKANAFPVNTDSLSPMTDRQVINIRLIKVISNGCTPPPRSDNILKRTVEFVWFAN